MDNGRRGRAVSTYAMSSSEELGQNSVEELELSRRSNQLLVGIAGRVDLIFHTLEQERMLADLAELHDHVLKTLDRLASTTQASQW